ncbi:Asp-tRNA(Asn)/Glu-tRNA(Gln) amidotransferase subunit GatB [Meiothermus taiwanensis]|jgi:aspartyl-tRNA(Asn)/glutamyl-tRNA(Gln) amidotransferase subunit B|uniref:Aspartyl/glutamyl-tRNA(Asn/Gln) amidotransferase subunit B n=2 Tax=Meiothermus taiwanensis TaxID=172827 RepID=A0A399E470_9DEIN|nr:Asp-tRNA(Asn)/Glu-tRNA(Gln) amidotransferase subunit GatB [Meiothermus taiwanensis]AWR85298.1 glutamyl-tRNA(Gln) amidotransferase, B subunit [Meiothermus taiwanensis WR-220]KIQ55771.1 glutamyl-tRNA amidotransferase [Meiothermus taiwanensis]KZK17061.1 aspartyl/glutamyl-tRNA amidotransferase subunit B [Meiothermus taiwanensis]RIH77520.1 Aspartyl/glutamyl-tRNA(Asn/Gln) amidotransferase subunit B [Meiothermus taiwanensis]
MPDFEAVVGLEVHLHLKTKSKMFCGCDADYFGDPPNTHTCPVCLGLPGVLPVVNAQAVEYGILFGLALNCQIAPWTQFHRKSYYYPDMPKNYQISQYDLPIAAHGYLEVEGQRVRIKRVHLEEDAAKSTHPEGAPYSLIDLNRAGSPLIEMVTEPDIRTPEQARIFLSHIRSIAQTLGVSDANPEEGKMRADVNVSVRRVGEPLGTKVEIKNLNSFRSVARALEYEIRRQQEILRSGRRVEQATLGFDEAAGKTYVMRLKEGEADYRYFPDPDLPPIVVDEAWLARLKAAMPELPAQKYARYVEAGVRPYDAEILAYNPSLARFFDQTLACYRGNPQTVANLLNADVAGYLNERQMEVQETALTPEHLAALAGLFERREITNRVLSQLLPEVMEGADPLKLVEERGLRAVADEGALRPLVERVVAANPKVVEQVKGGNLKAANALLGPIMKETKGTAKADVVKKMLGEMLGVEL